MQSSGVIRGCWVCDRVGELEISLSFIFYRKLYSFNLTMPEAIILIQEIKDRNHDGVWKCPP